MVAKEGLLGYPSPLNHLTYQSIAYHLLRQPQSPTYDVTHRLTCTTRVEVGIIWNGSTKASAGYVSEVRASLPSSEPGGKNLSEV